jgi:hypothetical protein
MSRVQEVNVPAMDSSKKSGYFGPFQGKFDGVCVVSRSLDPVVINPQRNLPLAATLRRPDG